jgi:hypothetical protein
LLRVVDESGEDYLYPKELFRPIELPQSLQRVLLGSVNLQSAGIPQARPAKQIPEINLPALAGIERANAPVEVLP